MEKKVNNSERIQSKGKRRKKQLLFEAQPPKRSKKALGKTKLKDIKVKSNSGVSSQLYSQSSTNGKAFKKQ